MISFTVVWSLDRFAARSVKTGRSLFWGFILKAVISKWKVRATLIHNLTVPCRFVFQIANVLINAGRIEGFPRVPLYCGCHSELKLSVSPYDYDGYAPTFTHRVFSGCILRIVNRFFCMNCTMLCTTRRPCKDVFRLGDYQVEENGSRSNYPSVSLQQKFTSRFKLRALRMFTNEGPNLVWLFAHD